MKAITATACPQRIEEHVLPFFSKHLSFAPRH